MIGRNIIPHRSFFQTKYPNEEKGDGSSDRGRGDDIAAPVIVDANPGDGDEERDNEERNAIAREKEREGEKQAPEIGASVRTEKSCRRR